MLPVSMITQTRNTFSVLIFWILPVHHCCNTASKFSCAVKSAVDKGRDSDFEQNRFRVDRAVFSQFSAAGFSEVDSTGEPSGKDFLVNFRCILSLKRANN